MTTVRDEESPVERLVAALMHAVFATAFGCLAVGLALWLANRRSQWAAILLMSGLLALMLLPTLRLVAAIASARRERDRLLLASTLTVLAILFALTFRDAASLR